MTDVANVTDVAKIVICTITGFCGRDASESAAHPETASKAGSRRTPAFQRQPRNGKGPPKAGFACDVGRLRFRVSLGDIDGTMQVDSSDQCLVLAQSLQPAVGNFGSFLATSVGSESAGGVVSPNASGRLF